MFTVLVEVRQHLMLLACVLGHSSTVIAGALNLDAVSDKIQGWVD